MNEQDLKLLELLLRRASLSDQTFITSLLKDAVDTLRYDLNSQYTDSILKEILHSAN